MLNKKISFKNKLLLALYHVDKRVPYEELMIIMGLKKRKKLTDTMKDLRNDILVHQNIDGIKLSSIGLREVEKIIEKNGSIN